MQIIDVGMCVDNRDPKGIGRIRYRPYGLYKSEIAGGVTYKDWDENDPHIAMPFLPSHINIIPQFRQSIQILRYDTDKPTQNVVYVSGPYSTPHDFESQEFTIQHKDTTYGGVIVTDLPSLRTPEGTYVDKKSEGAVANLNDISIDGNYGSDVVFTENGLVLRGGKLINKSTPTGKFKQRLKEVPLLAEKVAKINLKKFPRTMELYTDHQKVTKVTVGKIKHIVEYDIDSLTNPTRINLYVYKVLDSFGDKYDTNVFNDGTDLDLTKVKLLNLDGTITGATATESISTIGAGSAEMRELLHIIDQKSLYELDQTYPKDDIHPFYFRPTSELKNRATSNDTQKTNKKDFITNIHTRDIGAGSALIFSRASANAPIITVPKKNKKLRPIDNAGEQSIGSMTADLLYLLSTNNNKGPNFSKIDFTKVSPYEYSQQDYLSEIDPKTYATVRGEVLVKMLYLMYEVLIGHVHNINEPAIYKEEKEQQLRDMIQTMNKYLINHSVRIN